MSVSKGMLRGKKISSNHQTVTNESGPVILFAKELEEVTKIVVGRIVSAKGGKQSIKIKRIQAGLELKVRGRTDIQTLLLYTKDPDATIKSLSDSFTCKL